MRTLAILCCVALLPLLSCSPKLYTYQKQYMPEAVHAYPFGMPLADWEARHPGAVPVGEPSFRVVHLVEAVEAPLENMVFYFDNEGSKPLYEMILAYRTEAGRDAWVARNLGTPNHGDEWLFDSGEGYEINIWAFQNKLIFAAAIPGCEWDENRDGKMDPSI